MWGATPAKSVCPHHSLLELGTQLIHTPSVCKVDAPSFLSRAFSRTCVLENIPVSLHHAAPSGPPLGFTVTQRTARNMTFSWSPPAPTLRNGVITGYSLSCVSEAGGGRRNTISKQYTAAGTFRLGGFTPATSYNCSVSARNIWGNGPVSYSVVATQDDGM